MADIVWNLYAHTISRCGSVPTMIEWDNDVPAWRTLMEEAVRADAVLSEPAQRHVAAE